MKKIILFIILIALIVSGIFFIYNKKDNEGFVVASDYKNISYDINGQTTTLRNGESEVEAAPGSASKIVTKYFGNEIKKDLNGDGREDVVFILTQETGGSGVFFYVVAALATENGYEGSHALLLGDRVAPQTTKSGPENSIIVNYMIRTADEPMSASPSVDKSLRLVLNPTTMQFEEKEQNFEKVANSSQMSLTMKTWNWEKTEYNDGKIVIPKKNVFTITFKNDGTFGATTDCNSIGGKYTTTESSITFKDMLSTLMACEDSQESDFRDTLGETMKYEFTSKGELVLNLKSDSGSVYLKQE